MAKENKDLADKRHDHIISELRQIKTILMVVAGLILSALFVPASVFESMRSFLLYGAVLAAVIYVSLLLLERYIARRKALSSEDELQQKILSEFKAETKK